MINILTALYTKLSSSTFMSELDGRVYLDKYPEDESPTYPYCIYSVVTSPKDRTFTEEYRDTIVQFSIYSESSSATELPNIYAYLVSLLDECSMSIISNTLVWCREINLVSDTVEAQTKDGTKIVKVWYVDFEIRTSKD